MVPLIFTFSSHIYLAKQHTVRITRIWNSKSKTKVQINEAEQSVFRLVSQLK